MSTATRPGPFATKPTEQLIEAAEGTRLGQTRVAYSMCRDGLMPERLATIWEKTRTPVVLTLVFAIPIALLAASVPLKKIAELVNIGTLPLVPVFPLIGAALCVYLMTKLPAETWLRFGLWLLLGLLIYVAYGYRNSHLRRGADVSER